MGKMKDSTIPEWDTHSRLEDWSAGMRDGYVAALRDAVNVLRDLDGYDEYSWGVDENGGEGHYLLRDDAIEALDRLKEKP